MMPFLCCTRRPAALVPALLVLVLLPGTSPALTFPLPPPGEAVVGELQQDRTRYEDTLSDVARKYDVGYSEMVAANPGVDPWLPGEGTDVTVPTRFILPPGPRKGIVINIAEMRLYYYPAGKKVVITHPIGIGREGWGTPVGSGTILDKVKGPSWTPPPSIRAEHAERGDILPAVVPAGPNNPLGAYAMRLSIPGYLIHGTNKPFGVGMRVSHGCIRLYPEDIESLFGQIPPGTSVRIINEPYKAGWQNLVLYLEAHAPLTEHVQAIGDSLTPMTNVVISAQGDAPVYVDWDKARTLAEQHTGIPMPLAIVGPELQPAASPPPEPAAGTQEAAADAEAEPATGWMLQLGSFRQRLNVERIRQTITEMRLPLRIEDDTIDGMQRILVGPFTSHDEALAVSTRVRNQLGIEPLLMPSANKPKES